MAHDDKKWYSGVASRTIDKHGRKIKKLPKHTGWSMDTGTPKRTKKPRAITTPVDSPRATTTAPAAGATRPKKVTYGHGKDKAGKSLGITTVVDAGHSPSAAKLKQATSMAKNQKPKSGKKFKFGSNLYGSGPPKGKWGPHGPYRLPDYAKAPPTKAPDKASTTSTGSFSAKGIAAAIVATTAAITTGVIAKQQLSGKPRRKSDAVAKRNTSPQIQAARARKPIDPAKVKAIAIGARREHGDPYKANKQRVQTATKAFAASDKRAVVRDINKSPAGGRGNLKGNARQINNAFDAAERADSKEKAKFEPPKSPTVEETKVEVSESTPREYKPQSVASRVRDAFRPDAELAEIQAARKRGRAPSAPAAPTISSAQPSKKQRITAASSDARTEALAEEQASRAAVKAPVTAKVETPVDVPEEPAKKPNVVKRAAKAVANAVPAVTPARKKAKKARKAAKITTPVDPKPAAEAKLETFAEQAQDLSQAERQIEISKREAELETARAGAAQRVANAQAKLARQTAAAAQQGLATDVPMPKPKTQAEDQAEAASRAKARKRTPKAEGYTPWSPEDIKRASPTEVTARRVALEKVQAEVTTPVDNKRTPGDRRSPDRMTQKQARTAGMPTGETGKPAPKKSTRRSKPMTTPALPKVTTPVDAEIPLDVNRVVTQHAEAAKAAEPERSLETAKPKAKKAKGNKKYWNAQKGQWELRGEVDVLTGVTDRGRKIEADPRIATLADVDASDTNKAIADAAKRDAAKNAAKIEAHSITTPVSTTPSTVVLQDTKNAAERAGLTKAELEAKTTVVAPREKKKQLTPEEEALHTKNKARITEIEGIVAEQAKQTTTIGEKMAEALALHKDPDKNLTEEQKKAKLAKQAADPSVQRIVRARLGNDGEHTTEIVERAEIDLMLKEGADVKSAVDKRLEDRRQANRRGPGRMTQADALKAGIESAAAKNAPSRRHRGGDPRGTGVNPLAPITTPVDVLDAEIELKIPEVSETDYTLAEREQARVAQAKWKQEQYNKKGVDRRAAPGETVLEQQDAEEWKETAERAKHGDDAAQEAINKGRRQWRGEQEGKRSGDMLERAEAQLETAQRQGVKAEGASVPLAIRAQPADYNPETVLSEARSSVDPIVGNQKARILKRIAFLKDSLKPGGQPIWRAHQSLADAERQLKGLDPSPRTARPTSALPPRKAIGEEGKRAPRPLAGGIKPIERRGAPGPHLGPVGERPIKTSPYVNVGDVAPGERRRAGGRRVVNTPVGPAMTVLPEERRILDQYIESGEQRKHQATAEGRSTTVRGNERNLPDRRTSGTERRTVQGQGPTGGSGGRTFDPATSEAAQVSTPGQNKATTEGWWTGAKKSVNRIFDVMGKAKATLTSPMIDRVAENARKTYVKEGLLRKAGKGTVNVGIGAAVLGTAFAATDAIASVFNVEGAGRSQRDKIRDAAETALETGMDTAVGVTEFTIATKAAAAAGPGGVPFTIAANVVLPIGVMAGTAAAVGSVAGKTKHQWDSQVQKEISEKAVMDAKYGTIERATQTRRNRNRKISLDDTETIMQRWDDEAKAKRTKRINDAKKPGRRPRGV